MRKLLLGLVLFFAAAISHAQSSPSSDKVYKDWSQHFEESKALVDVSYRIIKCNGVDQVHFLVFNENVIDQQVSFTVEISDAVTKSITTKAISFAATKATVYKAECSLDNKFSNLRIALPEGYDPDNATVKIIFKP